MRVLLTGAAGFIGFHLAHRLLSDGHEVAGIDGITPYYQPTLKRRRLEILAALPGFVFHEIMLEDARALADCVCDAPAEIVVHLAAQPGVRYSAENPRAYIESNIMGTFNLMEALKAQGCSHLLVASTSSVYGAIAKPSFAEDDRADRPLSLYAATKEATEALSHSYSHLTKIPTTVLRLFTVYGPWGRPDMAIFKFTKNIIEGLPIDVYGHGDMARDFTYVDDVVEAVCRLIPHRPGQASADGQGSESPVAPLRIVNVGGGRPVQLEDFIAAIENAVGRKAIRNYLPMQQGDVPSTNADTRVLERLTGFRPTTPVEIGVRNFVSWYREYYGVNR
jgi:UDP-glucuronate 4-epimerase